MPDIAPLLSSLRALYEQYGYLIVFAAELGGNTIFASIFFPAGTFAVLAGYFAQQGTLNIFLVILCVWAGTVTAFHSDYLLGRLVRGGMVRRTPRTRLGKRLALGARLERGKRFVDRYGGNAIIICHAWAHLRSFVALGAGVARMRYPTFLAYEVVSALIWSSLYCALGYFIGANQNEIGGLLEQYGIVALSVILAFYALFVLGQVVLRRRLLAATAPDEHAHEPALALHDHGE